MTILKHLKTPLRILAVFLLIVLLLYILITQTTLPEQLANKILQRKIGAKYGVQISFENIGGSLISNIYIDNINVHYEFEDTVYQIARINKLQIEYSLTDLWRKNWKLRGLDVDTFSLGMHDEFMKSLESDSSQDSTSLASLINFEIESCNLRAGEIRDLQKHDSLFCDDINFSFSLTKTDDQVNVRIDTTHFALVTEKLELADFTGNFALTDSIVRADSVHLTTLGSDIKFSGVIDDLDNMQGKTSLKNSVFDLETIGAFFGIELEGELELNGEISGTPESLYSRLTINGDLFDKRLNQLETKIEFADGILNFYELRGGAVSSALTGNGYLDFSVTPNEYLFSGIMQDFDLNSMIENTFETSFSGEVIIEGTSFSEEDFVLNMRMALGNGFFDLYSFDSVYGYADVYYDSIKFIDSLHVKKEGADIKAIGMIEYSNQIQISGTADFPDITPLTEMIELEYFSGRGKGEFEITGFVENPGLKAKFSSDSIEAFGIAGDSLNVTVDLTRFAEVLEGDVFIESGIFHYDIYDGDSMYAHLSLDSNLLIIDSCKIFSKRFNAGLALVLDTRDTSTIITVNEFETTLDTFLIHSVDSLFFIASDSAFYVDRFRLMSENGELNVRGKYSYNDSLNFSFDCRDLELFPIISFYAPEQILKGKANLEGNIMGSLEDPIFNIKGSVDSLDYMNQYYGFLNFIISYEDRNLRVDSFSIESNENFTVLSGSIPIDLAFITENDSRIIKGKNIDLKIKSGSTPLYILSVILPDLEWITGNNLLELKVSGTLDQPTLDGKFSLRKGEVKLYYLENVLNNVYADVRFSDRMVYIDKLESIYKKGNTEGKTELSGDISLEDIFKPYINLRVNAYNYPFKYDLGDIEGVIREADINIYGRDTIDAVGWVDLSSFTYADQFEPAIKTEALEAVDTVHNFNYIIDITAPSNLKVVNNDFDCELGGELRVFQQGDFLNFLGELETIRGKYFFFDQTFKILPGGVIRFNDISEFNPELNLELETFITAQGERLRAHLLLSGTLLEPILTTSSESEVGESQFLEWLSFQRIVAGDETSESPFGERLQEGVSNILISRATQYFARRIGVETFEINPNMSGTNFDLSDVELRIGLYTMPNLYIYGTTRLNFEEAQEVGFEYRFSRNFFLSGQRDKANLYHLDMNLNWDF